MTPCPVCGGTTLVRTRGAFDPMGMSECAGCYEASMARSARVFRGVLALVLLVVLALAWSGLP